ncbi:universal stress protein [Deinococcus sp. YIM 77859]|uniref:universal stress protein n=1 Tax=Deinococcus sp. YIM 77859 TaxID=1540221 RepID=UPI000555A0ED|nr:universal stress protein [Deinococcus sp. YIM 77859]
MKFVVACDGSEPSLRALRHAVKLARAAGAQLDLITVIEEPPVSPFVQWAGLDPGYVRGLLERQAREAREAALAVTEGAGVTAHFRTLRGRPVDVLLAAAQEADLLVLGTHGYRGMDRVLLGSVAESLLRRAQVPLLVVP